MFLYMVFEELTYVLLFESACRYLQEAFKVPVVIQLTDDEKFMWSKTLKVEDTKRLARENIKDIIACGFDVEKTFIFSNIKHAG